MDRFMNSTVQIEEDDLFPAASVESNVSYLYWIAATGLLEADALRSLDFQSGCFEATHVMLRISCSLT